MGKRKGCHWDLGTAETLHASTRRSRVPRRGSHGTRWLSTARLALALATTRCSLVASGPRRSLVRASSPCIPRIRRSIHLRDLAAIQPRAPSPAASLSSLPFCRTRREPAQPHCLISDRCHTCPSKAPDRCLSARQQHWMKLQESLAGARRGRPQRMCAEASDSKCEHNESGRFPYL